MIYAKTVEQKAAKRSRVAWLIAVAVGVLAAAAVATVLVLPSSGSEPGIGGAITYRSQEVDITVRPNGEQIATRFVEPVAQVEASIPGVWVAPDPSEVAQAILFFSGRRSEYITGQILSVSGGLTMAG